MRIILQFITLAIILLSACNYSRENKVFKTHEDSATAQYDRTREDYCLKKFWKNLDTLNLDTVTIFENSLMCYNSLPATFFKMTHLKFVKLDTETQLNTLSDNIGKLTQLETLEITKSNLKTLPKSIGQLKNLKKLTIAWGGQLEEIPREIRSLEKLEELDLFRNKLTTLPKDIANLKQLKKLILGENNFTESEKKRISKLLPNCEIQFEFNSAYHE